MVALKGKWRVSNDSTSLCEIYPLIVLFSFIVILVELNLMHSQTLLTRILREQLISSN